ncbi:MAG: hydroxyethylthiazole kinase [Candidatus Micrarchaeota archaeon]
MNLYESLLKVRARKPLIHHITNWVTICDCANVTRAVGALPVMAHAPEEVEEMTGISNALVLNIGTLTRPLVDSMLLAGKKANSKHIPVVLDAVGVGATSFRSSICTELLERIEVDVLKGNVSEIGSILGVKSVVRGVEAAGVAGKPEDIAGALAEKIGRTVVITGKTDIISGRSRTLLVNNGHELMGKVVGTGCMAASVIASFCAVERNYIDAAASALACYGIAGEIAASQAKGPGTFKECFYDALYGLDEAKLQRLERITSYDKT